MNTYKIILLAIVFICGGKIHAQELKIAHINVEYVLSQWPAVKALESELKTYEEQLMKDIQAKQQELQALVRA